MEIRPITLEDFNRYRTNFVSLFTVALSLNFPNNDAGTEALSYFEKMYQFFIDGSAIVLVTLINNELAGFNWAHEVNVFGQRRLHSDFIIVDEKYQNQGIAKALLAKIEIEAKQRNINYVEALCSVSNEIAVNYHLKNGFAVERLKVVKELK
ncbi:MAG: GNAT family N-acetyltransferase [Sphaerochaetaceae bacterium]